MMCVYLSSFESEKIFSMKQKNRQSEHVLMHPPSLSAIHHNRKSLKRPSYRSHSFVFGQSNLKGFFFGGIGCDIHIAHVLILHRRLILQALDTQADLLIRLIKIYHSGCDELTYAEYV